MQEHLAAIEMARLTSEAVVTMAAQAKDASHAEPNDAVLKARADLLGVDNLGCAAARQRAYPPYKRHGLQGLLRLRRIESRVG